jgi:hypothetical protein
MKKVLLTVLVLSIAYMSKAQPPAGEAKPGEWYGEKVNPDGAVNIKDVAAKLGETGAVDTRIKAKIVDVCSRKGCWLRLQVNDSTTALVKMKDYGFFLPLAAKGKTVVIDGNVQVKTTSVAQLQHYAEDAKKSKEEIAAITKPEQEIHVLAKGIVVVE